MNVAKLNFSADVLHSQQSLKMPNLLHKLAAQAHELWLPCVIFELHFVNSTLCVLHLSEICLCFTFHDIIIVNVICVVNMMAEDEVDT